MYKNIRNIRFYTFIQTSVASTSRWNVQLFVNGSVKVTSWGSAPNNVNNQRCFNVIEWGGILANSLITVVINPNTLPASVQNNNSYFVVEYDL